MKLKRIVIKNFRSIKSCNLYVRDVCAIVGENNSGKSALLRAVNAFFNYENEEEDFLNGTHQHTARSHPTIELTFDDLPDDREISEKADQQDLIIKMKYSLSTKKRSLTYKNGTAYHNLEVNFINTLKQYISFVFIPPFRDSRAFRTEEGSLLQKVLGAYLEKATANRDTYSSRVKAATSYLEDQALAKISRDIGKIYSLSHKFDFNFRYRDQVNYEILLKDIQIFIKDYGAEFNIVDCGSGIQSLTVVALHRYLASLKHKQVIIGLEEPETNLHPQSQRELVKSIRSVSKNSHEAQIIFTTHSSTITDQLDHREIVLCRKEADQSRGFSTTIRQIAQNFWDKHSIPELQYRKFYLYRNSDFFFAKKIVLTESKNDAEIVRVLLEKVGIDLDVYGVSIINLEGTGNLSYPYFLAKELNIPIFMVLDKDYFLPYCNDKLEDSRNGSGFPKYKYEFKKDCLVHHFIKDKAEINKLMKLFKTNHSRALDLLEKYDLICFNYSLEIDLISSQVGSALYWDILDVSHDKRTQKELLVDRKKQIKDIKNLLYVVGKMPLKNLPNSYKRIRKSLKQFITQ